MVWPRRSIVQIHGRTRQRISHQTGRLVFAPILEASTPPDRTVTEHPTPNTTTRTRIIPTTPRSSLTTRRCHTDPVLDTGKARCTHEENPLSARNSPRGAQNRHLLGVLPEVEARFY